MAKINKGSTAAETVLTKAYKEPYKRFLVLRQLLTSIEHAQSIAPGSWSVTLLKNGFRLNVGATEVLIGLPDQIEINLFGKFDKLKHSERFDIHEGKYAACPKSTRYSAFIDHYESVATELQAAHFEFIKACAFTSTGKPYSKSLFQRFNNPELLEYAKKYVSGYEKDAAGQAVEHPVSNDHFVAYHNAEKMGYEYDSQKELVFYSTKLGVLKKAIGNTVWVIQGTRYGNKIAYTLCGAYVANHIDPPKNSTSDNYVIRGSAIKIFNPPVALNQLKWFPELQHSQGNFGLGFNRIKESIATNLSAFLSKNDEQTNEKLTTDADVEQMRFYNLVQQSIRDTTAARRERLDRANKVPIVVFAITKYYFRNPDVVAEVLHRSNGKCEYCKKPAPFNRRTDESPYLEVHHKVQLSSGGEDTVENALALCPNCHREQHFGMNS